MVPESVSQVLAELTGDEIRDDLTVPTGTARIPRIPVWRGR